MFYAPPPPPVAAEVAKAPRPMGAAARLGSFVRALAAFASFLPRPPTGPRERGRFTPWFARNQRERRRDRRRGGR